MANFSFNVVPTNPEKPLAVSVLLNDAVVFATEYLTEKQTVCVEFDDEVDGVKHTIKIVLKNKTAAHTQINEFGEIVNDSMIAVSDVELNEIALGRVFFEKCSYTHSFNSDAEPIKDEFYGDMGCNGVVAFEFTTPSYLWLLENL